VRNAWFETVAEAQRRAKQQLPQSVCRALVAGPEKGVTVSDNIDAFSELGFAPTVAGKPAKRDLATTVMSQPVSLPVIISPTGVQAVHPDGEVAVARAAAARGTVMGLSSFASKPVEEVVAANPKTFFQTYWVGTREDMLQHMARGRAAGAAGLILTLDWAFANGRDWGSPASEHWGGGRLWPGAAERGGDRRARPAHPRGRDLRMVAIRLCYSRRAAQGAERTDGCGDRLPDLGGAGFIGALHRRGE